MQSPLSSYLNEGKQPTFFHQVTDQENPLEDSCKNLNVFAENASQNLSIHPDQLPNEDRK
jgi:hypothetical protein